MRYEKGNPIDYLKAKSSTCDFKLLLGSADGPESEKMTYFDFIVGKEHMFLRNILEKEDLENWYSIENLTNYYKYFKKSIEISVLLNEFFSRDSNIEYIEHDCVKKFMGEYLDLPVLLFAIKAKL